jgi:hypothetical protein
VDLDEIRRAPEAHAQAIVVGDMEDAVRFMAPDAREHAKGAMAEVATTVTAAEIDELAVVDDEAVVRFRLLTSNPIDPELWLETRWVSHRDKPVLLVGHLVRHPDLFGV